MWYFIYSIIGFYILKNFSGGKYNYNFSSVILSIRGNLENTFLLSKTTQTFLKKFQPLNYN